MILLRLDHLFLFAIIPTSFHSLQFLLRLDHLFLFAIIGKNIDDVINAVAA